MATANEEIRGVQVTKGRDASNTHQIQVEFVNDILKRFKRIRGLIRKTVGYQNDAFDLSSNQDDSEPVEVFDFPTDKGQIQAFIRQLKEWIQNEIVQFNDPLRIQNGDHWTAEYLQNAYVTGVQTAQGRLMSEGVGITASTPEDILDRPVSVRQLQQIYTRAYEQLTDITEDMANTIRNELTEAIREGENPRKVAGRINQEIQKIGRTRAVALARTEISHSHAQAAMNTYEQAGANIVSHTSRMTARDTHVCPWCRRLDDVPFTLREFQSVVARWRGQTWRVGVPGHVNCRCSPAPIIGFDEELDPLEERVPGTIINR